MSDFYFKLTFYFFLLAFGLSCRSNKSETETDCTPKIINPNGDSELALLMREFYDFSDSIKIQSQQNRAIDTEKLKALLNNLTTATPTDSNVHGEVFNGFAEKMKWQLNNLKPDSNFVLNFNNMVNACVDCHNEFCPGPIKKINKLKIAN
jgi:hypothetical protein